MRLSIPWILGVSYRKRYCAVKFFLGIGAPVLLAVIWGAFGSPKAKIKLSWPLHLFLELIVFGIPALHYMQQGNLS
ncbi:YrdB family protein [Niallia oryzisoli]|uniref:YrdB family protein n=1 Tax=Niallia oryzisoli TaxID=1737571 RepID=UPI003BAF13C0